MAVLVSESLKIRELQSNLLDQKKAYALLLHDKETADTERDLLREKVCTLCRDKDLLTRSSSFPAPPSCSPTLQPILHSEISNCGNAEDSIKIDILLENLRLAYGACKIREEGGSLVSHLRDRAAERKRAFLVAEERRKYALIELETTEIRIKVRENELKKEIEDLSQENEAIREELDIMKVVYSLRKGMSRENEMRNSYERQLTSLADLLDDRESQLSELYTERIRLAEALCKTEGERNKMLDKYHKLEDRYNRERGGNIVSRTCSFSQPTPTQSVEMDIYLHERSSSASSKISQRSLPRPNS